jgi:hypothetical protein
MCETMFLHFVPVDGVEYFSGFFWWERYVFMFPENKPVDKALRYVSWTNIEEVTVPLSKGVVDLLAG